MIPVHLVRRQTAKARDEELKLTSGQLGQVHVVPQLHTPDVPHPQSLPSGILGDALEEYRLKDFVGVPSGTVYLIYVVGCI